MEDDKKDSNLAKAPGDFSRKWQRFLQKIGLMKSPGRRPYHVGWLAPGKTLEDLRVHLHSEWGFGKSNKEIKDREIVLLWCKITTNHEDYVLHVYKDGEIRGFYEKLPVTGVLEKPSEMGEKEAKEQFLKFLGEFSVEKKYISELKPFVSQVEPSPEIIQ